MLYLESCCVECRLCLQQSSAWFKGSVLFCV